MDNREQQRREFMDRPFSGNACVSVQKKENGFLPMLKNEAGEVYDTGPTCVTRLRAHEAAWSEWRKRCNAHANSINFDREPGWDSDYFRRPKR